MLWWKNVIGTMVVVIGIETLAGGAGLIVLAAFQFFRLPTRFFIASLSPGIALAIVGFIALFTGNICPKKPHIQKNVGVTFLVLCALVCVGFLGGGIFAYVEKKNVLSHVGTLNYTEAVDFAVSLNFASTIRAVCPDGGSYRQSNVLTALTMNTTTPATTTTTTPSSTTTSSLSIHLPHETCFINEVYKWVDVNMDALALIAMVVGAFLLAAFIAGVFVTKWNEKDEQKQQHEEKGLEMPEINADNKPYYDSDDENVEEEPVLNPLNDRAQELPNAKEFPQGGSDIHV